MLVQAMMSWRRRPELGRNVRGLVLLGGQIDMAGLEQIAIPAGPLPGVSALPVLASV
jgi:hypothetical protein